CRPAAAARPTGERWAASRAAARTWDRTGCGRSREQDGREPLAAIDGQRVGEAQRLEELEQLLARRRLVPVAVELDHGEQLVDRLLALAARPVGEREVEADLEVLRVGRGLGLEITDRPCVLGLLGEVDRGLHGGDLGVALV